MCRCCRGHTAVHKPFDISGPVGEMKMIENIMVFCIWKSWVTNEWMTHFPVYHSDSEFHDCLSASSTMQSDFTLLLSLVVHDDDDGEGVTCNQERFPGQEINLWQDLFFASVVCITEGSRTLTSVQLLSCADIRLAMKHEEWKLWGEMNFEYVFW